MDVGKIVYTAILAYLDERQITDSCDRDYFVYVIQAVDRYNVDVLNKSEEN